MDAARLSVASTTSGASPDCMKIAASVASPGTVGERHVSGRTTAVTTAGRTAVPRREVQRSGTIEDGFHARVAAHERRRRCRSVALSHWIWRGGARRIAYESRERGRLESEPGRDLFSRPDRIGFSGDRSCRSAATASWIAACRFELHEDRPSRRPASAGTEHAAIPDGSRPIPTETARFRPHLSRAPELRSSPVSSPCNPGVHIANSRRRSA